MIIMFVFLAGVIWRSFYLIPLIAQCQNGKTLKSLNLCLMEPCWKLFFHIICTMSPSWAKFLPFGWRQSQFQVWWTIQTLYCRKPMPWDASCGSVWHGVMRRMIAGSSAGGREIGQRYLGEIFSEIWVDHAPEIEVLAGYLRLAMVIFLVWGCVGN